MQDEYLDFMNNQQSIRNELTEIAIRNMLSFRQLGRDIGLATSTICKFIRLKEDISFLPLSKMKNYCDTNRLK